MGDLSAVQLCNSVSNNSTSNHFENIERSNQIISTSSHGESLYPVSRDGEFSGNIVGNIPITKRELLRIKCKLNGVQIDFEIDTGSEYSFITEKYLMDVPHNRKESSQVIQTFTGEAVKVLGETYITIEFIEIFGKPFTMPFKIVPNEYSNLLGRDACNRLGLVITSSDNIKIMCLDDIFIKYKTYLSSDFKSDVIKHVSFKIKENDMKIFMKKSPETSRGKNKKKKSSDKLYNKLSQMERNGTINKIDTSYFASTFTFEREIEIYPHFSSTVDQVTYPITYENTSIDTVIAEVGTPRVFGQISCSNVYEQLPLDEKSKELCVIKTRHGLYRYNFLPCGTPLLSELPRITYLKF